MTLADLVELARAKGASDLHLEAGVPATLRVRGKLVPQGAALRGPDLVAMAQELLGESGWSAFKERGSADLARNIAGVRCRLNVLRSARGVGFAVRLFLDRQPDLSRLNLHPSLADLADFEQGLVLVCGPTGSGKSSTLAGLVEEVNRRSARHVITIEKPIEYALQPKRSFVRQREVGRDTPSFQRGLLDALREDPDVLLVGEMRAPRTMRLVLGAAETGHLVLSTLHSSSCADALQRMTAAFAPEIQPNVRAQLADVLVAVVCQRLPYRPELGFRVPECEVLHATRAVRNLLRNGDFFKLEQVLETGAGDGHFSFERYRRWIDGHGGWTGPAPAGVNGHALTEAADPEPAPEEPAELAAEVPATPDVPDAAGAGDDPDVIVLKPTDESIEEILSELDDESLP